MKKIATIIICYVMCFTLIGCGNENKIDLENNTSENLKYAREAVEYIYGCDVSACYHADEEDRPSGESFDNLLECYRFKMVNGKSAIIGIDLSTVVVIVIQEKNSDKFYHVSIGTSSEHTLTYTITDEIYG